MRVRFWRPDIAIALCLFVGVAAIFVWNFIRFGHPKTFTTICTALPGTCPDGHPGQLDRKAATQRRQQLQEEWSEVSRVSARMSERWTRAVPRELGAFCAAGDTRSCAFLGDLLFVLEQFETATVPLAINCRFGEDPDWSCALIGALQIEQGVVTRGFEGRDPATMVRDACSAGSPKACFLLARIFMFRPAEHPEVFSITEARDALSFLCERERAQACGWLGRTWDGVDGRGQRRPWPADRQRAVDASSRAAGLGDVIAGRDLFRLQEATLSRTSPGVRDWLRCLGFEDVCLDGGPCKADHHPAHGDPPERSCPAPVEATLVR